MNAAQDRATRSTARRVRWLALLAVLAVSTGIGLLHQNKGGAFVPVGVDALCPFGGVEALWTWLSQGAYLKRIAASSMVLLGVTVGIALVWGRAFCGQICPLGTLQEVFARLGGRLFGKRPVVPAAIDVPARYLKYAVLAVFTLWTWRAGELVMRPYDPWAAYHHLTSPELMAEFAIGALVLLVAVLGSLVYDRFFCKYACPMGATLGLLSRLSAFKVRRDPDTCIDCGACDRACPVNIPVSPALDVSSAECLSCSECINACPVPGALSVSTRKGRTMAPLALTLATLGVFFGVIAVSWATGDFAIEQPTLSGEMRRSQQTGAAPDTSTIKGWMSIQDISDATGIPAGELGAAFNVPDDQLATPLKEIEHEGVFSMQDVRIYVSERLAEPAR